MAQSKLDRRLCRIRIFNKVFLILKDKTYVRATNKTGVFKKNRQNTDVLFIDASKECVKRGPNNVLEGQHVEKILETFKNRNNIEKFSKKIAFSEIEENGFNLNIPRYIDTFEPEEIIPLGETLAELKQIDSEIMVAELNLASMLDELVSNNVAGQKEIDEGLK